MAEMDKINKLKEEITTLQGKLDAYQMSEQEANEIIAELKAENERLKEEVETRDNLIDHFRDEALYRATIASEYQKDKTKLEQTLQEIKAIAEAPKPFIDFSEIKTATEVEYDYAAICNELELRLHKVLELTTETEEE